MKTLTDLLAAVPPNVLWITGLILGLGILLVAFLAGRKAYRALRLRSLEDVLTVVAAGIATAVSASGMWQFFARIMPDVPWYWRVAMFAFIEVAVINSAVRAKRSMKEKYSAGVDGVAVWALTCLSAVLSALEAASLPEALFRLAAPLVAAWLWERGMAIERHRITGLAGINWRITPERILVRVGLAEARDRTASEVDSHRRLTQVALAAKRARVLRDSGASGRKLRTALVKLDRALDRAVEHTGLAKDAVLQGALLDQVSTLYGGPTLLDLPEVAPWAHIDHPAVTGARKNSEAVVLAEETRRLTDAILAERGHDREVSAAVTSMAALITGRHLAPDSTATGPLVAPEVAAQVAVRVAPAIALVPPITPRQDAENASIATADATDTDTSWQVADEVADRVAEDVLERLRRELVDGESDTGDDTETATASATEAMWRHWQKVIGEEERLPSGAELARAAGCAESYGRRMRGIWEEQMDGRVRGRLQRAKKVTA